MGVTMMSTMMAAQWPSAVSLVVRSDGQKPQAARRSRMMASRCGSG